MQRKNRRVSREIPRFPVISRQVCELYYCRGLAFVFNKTLRGVGSLAEGRWQRAEKNRVIGTSGDRIIGKD
jgi:hypothetical protein